MAFLLYSNNSWSCLYYHLVAALPIHQKSFVLSLIRLLRFPFDFSMSLIDKINSSNYLSTSGLCFTKFLFYILKGIWNLMENSRLLDWKRKEGVYAMANLPLGQLAGLGFISLILSLAYLVLIIICIVLFIRLATRGIKALDIYISKNSRQFYPGPQNPYGGNGQPFQNPNSQGH